MDESNVSLQSVVVQEVQVIKSIYLLNLFWVHFTYLLFRFNPNQR